jgi:hypothetical protein
LFSLIEIERLLKVDMLNGDNNSDFTKDPNYKTYVSGEFCDLPPCVNVDIAARTALRMMWFLEYMTELYTLIVENPQEESLSTLCSTAYSKTLGPRHSFGVRAAAKVAMLAAGNKNKAVEKLIRTHFCMRFHPFASRQNTS